MKKKYRLNKRGKIQLLAFIFILGFAGLYKVDCMVPTNNIVSKVFAIDIQPPQVSTSIVTEAIEVKEIHFTETETEIKTEVEDIVIKDTIQETGEQVVEEVKIVKPYDDETVEVLTNLLYGEARGLNDTHKSAVIWCVLNRYDNGKYGDSIIAVATAKNQFSGYKKGRVYGDMKSYENCKAIVIDVLDRYYTDEQIGRTLPKDYFYFVGNGKVNLFTQKWKGKNYWNWSLESPYKD